MASSCFIRRPFGLSKGQHEFHQRLGFITVQRTRVNQFIKPIACVTFPLAQLMTISSIRPRPIIGNVNKWFRYWFLLGELNDLYSGFVFNQS